MRDSLFCLSRRHAYAPEYEFQKIQQCMGTPNTQQNILKCFKIRVYIRRIRSVIRTATLTGGLSGRKLTFEVKFFKGERFCRLATTTIKVAWHI